MATEIQNVPPLPTLTKKDFTPSNEVRWCPGCGDYAILNSLQRTLPELGIKREDFVMVSGIGCSSRFPFYMNTYGFHSIHGRAPTVATGVKLANPDLSVWIITGDGDGLSIGGNHLLHVLRRNLNVNILLFNNRIYGLTKGQFSPTSPVGTKTKTSPQGSLEHPLNPVLFALGAEATFVARTADNNPKHMVETFKAAQAHQGVSFIEVFQNCVIFNDATWDSIYGKENRDDQMLVLEPGKPLLFGKDKSKGIRLNGLTPEVVPAGTDGILVHDPDQESPLYSQLLATLSPPHFPMPIGVIRRVAKPTYEQLFASQMETAAKKGPGSWHELLHGDSTWSVA
ncbi:MAG: 2-oxoacid:ferredoxin oxidoreductase subunit beta [Verrucomicrobia bacterium]|nr:2-oxoacid:ferredoxin oxidoreductase subunit beta [Verrucomicrobiota bacterium]